MKYRHRFPANFTLRGFITCLMFSGALLSTNALAQQATGQTPRESIVQGLGLDGLPIDVDEDLPIQTVISVPTTTRPIVSSEMPVKAVVRAEPKIANLPKLATSAAPFYLSAAEYLALRGGGAHSQIILDYDVQSGSVLGEELNRDLGAVENIKLILGADYAAIENGNNLKIYDFKFNRVLTVKSEYGQDGKTTSGRLFDNTSLYAKAYRDMIAVRRATRNGQLKKIPMGAGKTLDAFWIESAMSWSANEADMDMHVAGLENALIIKRKGEVAFSAEFSDTAYGAVGKDSLFAFAHHAWPLHPNVLRAFYGYSAPPQKFEMLSYGPTAPKGQRQVWTLANRTDADGLFPLPKHAIGVAQRAQTSPLVFLINEAVHNRALGGMESNDTLAAKFKSALQADEVEKAWLIGQKYIAYTNGCANLENKKTCQAVSDIARDRKEDVSKRTQDYMVAVNAARRPGLKAEAIKAVQPYLDDVETPAFIVRTAAMARAKMKLTQAQVAGVSRVNAEKLLRTALAKDPYDPNTYIGLAQVLAAKGAFEQSWDINDALRAGVPTAENVDLKIDRLEEKLRNSAPGYFLDK